MTSSMKLQVGGLILALGLLAVPFAADAQQAGKLPRIGVLHIGSPPTGPAPNVEVLRQALRDLGYVEGQTIAFEYRWAEGRFDRLPELAAELVALKVDIIVATAGPSVRAAKQATNTIPIVMAPVADPVGAGFVASLARPGGNITGLSFMVPDLSAKRLELLRELVPRVSRVAVLFEGDDRVNLLELRETRGAAQALGVTLQPLGVRDPNEFETAISAGVRGHAEALITFAHPFTILHRRQIVDLVTKSRLPAVYGLR